MLESFKRFLGGIWRHGWALGAGVSLEALDIAERAFPEWRLPSVPPVIIWLIILAGVLYATWRTYHDLWLSLPEKERKIAGFLNLNEAACEISRFWPKWKADYFSLGIEMVRYVANDEMENLVERGHISVFERSLSGEMRRLKDGAAYDRGILSETDGEKLNDELFVRRRDLKPALRRHELAVLVRAQILNE